MVDVFNSGSTPVYSYREVAFADSATPTKMSFYNVELLKPNKNNSFYLGYDNFYDLSIKDTYTGEMITAEAASPSSIMYVDESEKTLYSDRTYEIIYKLKDSYYIETKTVDDELITSINFD